jgi:WD40 repeat protein
LAVLGHGDVVFGAVWDPAGKQIVTVSRDGLARIWQWDAWQVAPELPAYWDPALLVADAQWDTAGGELFFVRTNSPPRFLRWESMTGAVRLSLPLDSLVYQLDWSQDRTRVLTAADTLPELGRQTPCSGATARSRQ